jgi:hypothetical protein
VNGSHRDCRRVGDASLTSTPPGVSPFEELFDPFRRRYLCHLARKNVLLQDITPYLIQRISLRCCHDNVREIYNRATFVEQTPRIHKQRICIYECHDRFRKDSPFSNLLLIDKRLTEGKTRHRIVPGYGQVKCLGRLYTIGSCADSP